MTYASVEYQLCSAVAAALATALTPEGEEDPAYDVHVVSDWRANRESLQVLEVRIMPAAWESPDQWRDTDPEEITVHVAAVGPADMGDLDSVDAGLALGNTLRALWQEAGALRGLEPLDGWTFKAPIRQPQLFRPDFLELLKLFVAAIAVTYKRQT
jgi:hypothetical protein